jgi:hypothetical protein
MLKYLVAMAVGVGIVFAFSSPKQSTAPVKTVNNPAYTDCLFSPETKFMAQHFQEKYYNLSLMQISQILCKDKK